MSVVPAENVAEVEVRGILNGIPVENTLYFQASEEITAALLQALVEALASWFVAHIIPRIAAGYMFKEVYAKDMSAGSGLNWTATIGTGTHGTYTGDALPNNVTWAIKFLTGLAGRSHRGRNYVAGLSEAGVSNNALASLDADGFTGDYRMLLGGGGIVPEEWQWGVLSRFHLGSPRVQGLFTPITGVSYTDLKVDSQRNRLK